MFHTSNAAGYIEQQRRRYSCMRSGRCAAHTGPQGARQKAGNGACLVGVAVLERLSAVVSSACLLVRHLALDLGHFGGTGDEQLAISSETALHHDRLTVREAMHAALMLLTSATPDQGRPKCGLDVSSDK